MFPANITDFPETWVNLGEISILFNGRFRWEECNITLFSLKVTFQNLPTNGAQNREPYMWPPICYLLTPFAVKNSQMGQGFFKSKYINRVAMASSVGML